MPRLRPSLLLSLTAIYITYRLLFSGGSVPVNNPDAHDEDIVAPSIGELPSWIPQPEVQEEIDVLNLLGLTSKFEYRRFCISATPKPNVERTSLQNAKMAFFRQPEGAFLSTTDLGLSASNSPAECTAQMNVDVPFFNKSAPVDTSALMLGMATTIPRLNASLPAMARWLGNTGTPLQILITDHAKLEDVQDEMDHLRFIAYTMGIELLFDAHEYPWESDGRKSFALARVLDWHKRPETKWLGIIDDDTFFVSLPQLLNALQPYDASKLWYIGTLTEGLTRLGREGWKASAGAGVFMSVPLMSIMAEHYDECRDLDEAYGDLLWRDCIIEFTSPTVPLTELGGLNQLDIWKDTSGWYESYHKELYTIHHWKSWHYHPVPVAHLVSDVAGPSSFLQRYEFHDDTVLHNGYSLVHYPHGVPDLNLVELTMVEDVGVTEYPHKREFLHKFGKTREAMKLGRTKLQWKFETAITSSDGTVKQFYVRKAWTKQGQNVDNVIQIDWTAAKPVVPIATKEDVVKAGSKQQRIGDKKPPSKDV